MLRWLRYLCIGVSALALIWLVMATISISFREHRMHETDAQTLATYLLGAAQQTARAVDAVKEGRPSVERLHLAETASRELSVSLIWYNQRHETAILPSLVVMYSGELHEIRRKLDANGSLGVADMRLLDEISHDLTLLHQLFTEEVLRRSRPAELAAIRQRVRLELHHTEARNLVSP